MARTLLLLAAALALSAGAGPSRSSGRAPDAGSPDPGKARRATARPVLVPVSGTAVHLHETHPCMGGAAVTPEMLQREITPLADQVLTFFTGRTLAGKVIARPRTDRAGRFSLRLEPGEYCVVVGMREPLPEAPLPDAKQPKALEPKEPDSPFFDSDCLERMKNPPPSCDARFSVAGPDPITEVRVMLYSSNQCSQPWAQPCWRGPAPP